MKFFRFFSLLFLLVSTTTQAAPADNEKPNVILIYADDLGIGLLGCYGQKVIETPHIDKLAAEGTRFTNHYGGVYCAPARWSLLTGMHDGRKGGWSQTRSGLPIQRDAGNITEEEFQKKFAEIKRKALPIPDNEIFLAQVAKQAGYKTAQFGKLDRGFLTWKEQVDRFGWDFHEGFYDHTRAHGFYPPYLWRNGEKFKLPGNNDPHCGKMSEKGDEPIGAGGETYSQNVFIEGILGYIRSHKDQRFFLYHPTQLPHGPVAIPELHPDYADREGWSLAEKKYASMVRMLDDHVGLIMAELKELGLDDKTAVFFTSDNGHELYYGPKWSYSAQKKADGKKADLDDRKWRTSEDGDIFDGSGGRAGLKRSGYQGGMQAPLIARWPGKFKAGSTSDRLTANYDFMATIAELTGTTLPKGKDSLSFLPTLIGKESSETHEYVVVNNQNRKVGGSAVIARDGFKLVEIERKKDAFQLYDIKTDNEERENLASKFPERLSELKAIFKEQMNSDRPDL